MKDLDLQDIKTLLKSAPRLVDGKKDERVKRATKDFKYAVDTYFSHHLDYETKETSKFRNFIYKDLDKLSIKNRNMLFEAYRGGAKTTVITRLFSLFKTAIQRKKRHVAIISSTIDVSKESLEFIKTELEDNQNLVHDFDIQIGSKIKLTWNKEEIVFKSGGIKFRIKVYGAGKKIRGSNWLGFRPDLILCDDIEDDEGVESSVQRDKLEKWFKKAIMKLKARKSTTYNIIVVGTRLHHDSLLARLSKRNDFVSYSFPLVLSFPHNISEVEKHNVKKSDIKGMIIDDTAIDKYELLIEYLEDPESFYSEYQNQPLSREDAIFSDYKTYKGEMPKCDAYSIAIDPSMGKKKGDYFGIAILGYKIDEKKFYAKVYGYKQNPIRLIPKIIKFYKKYDSMATTFLSVETVAYQEFFKDILKSEASKVGIFLSVKEYRNTADKDLRISSIAPHVGDGTILINEDDILLIEELETYPKAAHVDLLDALEMAWRNFKTGGKIDYKIVKKVFRDLRSLRVSKYG